MKKLSAIAVSAVLASGLLLSANPVLASTHSQISLIPMASYFSFASSRHIKNGGGMGLGIAYRLNHCWSAELDLFHAGSQQKRDAGKNLDATFVFANGIYRLAPLASLQPYLQGGVGGIHMSQSNGNNPSTQAAFDFGAGLSLPVAKRLAIRVGAVDYVGMTSNMTNDLSLNAGVVIHFGQASSTTASNASTAVTKPSTAAAPQAIQVNKKGIYILAKPKATSRTTQSGQNSKATPKPVAQTTHSQTDYSLYN